MTLMTTKEVAKLTRSTTSGTTNSSTSTSSSSCTLITKEESDILNLKVWNLQRENDSLKDQLQTLKMTKKQKSSANSATSDVSSSHGMKNLLSFSKNKHIENDTARTANSSTCPPSLRRVVTACDSLHSTSSRSKFINQRRRMNHVHSTNEEVSTWQESPRDGSTSNNEERDVTASAITKMRTCQSMPAFSKIQRRRGVSSMVNMLQENIDEEGDEHDIDEPSSRTRVLVRETRNIQSRTSSSSAKGFFIDDEDVDGRDKEADEPISPPNGFLNWM